MPDTYTLSVPDMSCGHCRASIEGALTPLGVSTSFDMENRRVTVTGPVAAQTTIDALDGIGFDAAPVSD